MTGWLSPSGVLTVCASADKARRAGEITHCDDEVRAFTLAKHAGWLWVETRSGGGWFMKRTTETKCPLCGTLWEVEFGEPQTSARDVAEDRKPTIPLTLGCPGCGLRPIPDAERRVVRGKMNPELAGDEEATQMIVDSLVEQALADLAEDAVAPLERKCRVYQFSVLSALHVLKTGFDLSGIVISKGFPSDAQYVRGWVDESTMVVNLVVHSEAFPVIDDGECMPVGRMEFETRPA